jgi:hypothetical protein
MAAEEGPTPKDASRSGAGSSGRRPRQPVTIDLKAEASTPPRESQATKATDEPVSNRTESPSLTASDERVSGKRTGQAASAATEMMPAWPSIAMLAGAGASGGLIVLILGFGLQAAGILPAPDSQAATEARSQIGTVSSKLSGLDQRVTAIEAASAQAVADRALLDDLSRQVGVVDAFGTSLSDRLLNVEASVASLKEAAGTDGTGVDGKRLDAIEERIARLETLPPLENANGSAPGLQSIQGEVAALTSKVNDLKARVDKLAAGAAATIESEDAARAMAVISLREAAASGGPFADELSMVEAFGSGADKLSALEPLAGKGAPSRAELVAEFPVVADAVLSAEQSPQDANGVIDRVLAYGRSLVKIRPTEPVAGNDAAAVVSRMQAALESGNIAEALKERDALSPAGKAASGTWAGAARDRVAIDTAIDALPDAVSSTGTSG